MWGWIKGNMNPIFQARVEKGNLVHDKDRFRHYLSGLPDGDYELILRKKKSQRSLNQNNYYWGVCIELISQHTGYDPDEIHEILKQMFLPKRMEIQTASGTIHKTISKSTTELDTKGMEEYLENIRRWAASELGCNVPEPNEISYEEER